jgi:hypothetical protein
MRLPKPRAPGLAASISSRTMPGSAQTQSDRAAGSAPSSSGRSRRISGDASSRSTQPHRWRSANAVVPEMMIAVITRGPRVRIHFPPAESLQTLGLSRQMGQNRTPGKPVDMPTRPGLSCAEPGWPAGFGEGTQTASRSPISLLARLAGDQRREAGATSPTGPSPAAHATLEINGPTFAHAILTTNEVIATQRKP